MHIHKQRRTRGFTLVEIMIVVAIIALLAAIAVPNFLRARKRSQATTILNELRILDNALDQYTIETNKSGNDFIVTPSDLVTYVKTGDRLNNALSSAADCNHVADIFGNDYGAGGSPFFTVAPATYNSLSDVAPQSFWSPYYSAGP